MPTDIFEEWVARRLNKITKWASTTIGSGNKLGDEDVKSDEYIIQCKRSETKRNFIIAHSDWEQLMNAMLSHKKSDGNFRTPVFIMQNSIGNKIAAVDIEDFFAMVEELNNLRKISDEHDEIKVILNSNGLLDALKKEMANGKMA